MSFYTCNACSYETSSKYNFEKHINTQKHKNFTQNKGVIRDSDHKHIKPVTSVITKKGLLVTDSLGLTITRKTPYICSECTKEFSNQSNYNRHKKKYCMGKSIVSGVNSNMRDIELVDLEGKLNDMGLGEDVKQSLLTVLNSVHAQNILNSSSVYDYNESNNVNSNNSISTNIGSNNNNNIGNMMSNNSITNNSLNQNIVVNQFGKDNWDHVSDDKMFDMLKRPKSMIAEAFKIVNLNPDVPENHNVMATNKSDGRIKVKENDGWFSKPKDETLTTIVDEKYYTMDTFYNNMKANYPDILKANMRPDEIATYEKFVLDFDRETNVENVNNPDMQPMMNQFKEDCFYSLTDFIYNLRLRRRLAKEAAKLAKNVKKTGKKNKLVKL